MRQIHEKCHEYNIDLHNIFIDFLQAFDTVNRDVVYNSLIKHNVQDKLIKVMKLTMQRTKLKVKVNNSYSEWFETTTEVRQGDPLSALLFSVVLDTVITSLEVLGDITTRLKQTRVELLVSYRVPPRVADRGMLARYGGYRRNKIPGADQNQYRCLAVDRGICKG